MTLEAFDTVDLIHAKRDGETLSTTQIDWLVDAYTRAYVGDEQMAAMAMAAASEVVLRMFNSPVLKSG